MIWIYNIAIRIYSVSIWLASFFNKKAELWIEGRKGIFEQLEEHLQRANLEREASGQGRDKTTNHKLEARGEGRDKTTNHKLEASDEGRGASDERRDKTTNFERGARSQERDARREGLGERGQEFGRSRNYERKTKNEERKTANQNIIWFHVASLGEFEQGRPIIEKLKEKYPSYKILLTFFSPSGFEIRKNYELADFVFYLPLDTKKNAKRFIEIINPKLVIFVKYEFWFHYLNTLQTKAIPTLLVSAVFRPEQQFFKWYGGIFKKILTGFDHIFLQNEASFQLLKKHGYKHLTLAGDTRVDRVSAIATQAKAFEIIEKFAEKNKILICGSTWPPDEAILIDFIKKNENWKFIIAPHEIEENNIKRLQKLLSKNAIKYTEANADSVQKAKVLIIDNIGILSSIYRYGKVAYIGGGFGKGIHNTLEPISFGLPVIFGPKFKKFDEAVILVNQGGSFTISNSDDFSNIMEKLDNEIFYSEASQEAQTYILKNSGATDKIVKYISTIL